MSSIINSIYGQVWSVASTTEPSNPVIGQIFYDPGDQTTYTWNGTSWIAVSIKSQDGMRNNKRKHHIKKIYE